MKEITLIYELCILIHCHLFNLVHLFKEKCKSGKKAKAIMILII